MQGYPVGAGGRRRLTATATIADLEAELDRLDPDLRPLPGTAAQPRGKTSGPMRVSLPDGWLAGVDDPSPVVDEEPEAVSGG